MKMKKEEHLSMEKKSVLITDSHPFGMHYRSSFQSYGLAWDTITHAIYGIKYQNIDPRFTKIIRTIKNPSHVEYLASINKNDVPDWESKKIDILYNTVCMKFMANEEVRRMLIDTESAPISYDGVWDKEEYELVLSEVRSEVKNIPFKQLSLLEK